jgi:large subunit ribosomal protein L25
VVISHQTVEVEVDALPKDLPEYLEVDLAKLEPGESVMLSQVVLPEGVTIPALEISEDNDHPIVTAIFIRASQGTGEAAAEADAALGEGAEVATVAESDADDESEGEESEGEDGDDEGKSDD